MLKTVVTILISGLIGVLVLAILVLLMPSIRPYGPIVVGIVAGTIAIAASRRQGV